MSKTNVNESEEKVPLIALLRRRIYSLESRNLRLKKGQKDHQQMVDEIIKTIKQTIEEREG